MLSEITRLKDSVEENYIYTTSKIALQRGRAAKAGETMVSVFLFRPAANTEATTEAESSKQVILC